jgi:hypothetical protein
LLQSLLTLQNCKTNTHNQAHSLKILFSNTQKTSNATENTSSREPSIASTLQSIKTPEQQPKKKRPIARK